MTICYCGHVDISLDVFCMQSRLLSHHTGSLSFLSLIGLIIHYIILRNGIEHFRGTEMSFTDTSGVQPYQEYSYQLRACTVAGCTDSSKVGEVGFMKTGARVLSASAATQKCFWKGVIWRHSDYWVSEKTINNLIWIQLLTGEYLEPKVDTSKWRKKEVSQSWQSWNCPVGTDVC